MDMKHCPRCGKPIAEHEAGRELDACVAQVVMGWQEVHVLHGVGAGVPPGKRGNVLHDDDFQMCRHYSTDGNAMMEVVERMRERWWVTLKFPTPHAGHIIEGARSEYDAPHGDKTVGVGLCSAELMWMGDERPWGRDEWAMADTAQLALCRAALAAMAGGGGVNRDKRRNA